jgi:cystathionine beta-synthase
MREKGVSQLPVMRDKEVVGVIAESALLHPLYTGHIKPNDAIEKLVDNNYSMVLESDAMSRLNEIFTNGKVAFVMEGGGIKYILTKIDLISFLSLQSGA